MAGQLIDQSDLTGLDNYLQVLHNLPAFTRAFKVNLDLVPAREYRTYKIPELEKWLSMASRDRSTWSDVLKALKTLHDELVTFIQDILQISAGIKNSQGVTRPFITRCQERLSAFVEAFDRQRGTLQSLTETISKILPRTLDFLNNNIYRHAHQYNLVAKNPGQNTAQQYLTASLSFASNGPALSPQARLNGARFYVQRIQNQYAEAYCSAANMNAYLSRMSQLLWEAFNQTLRMHKTPSSSRPWLETRLMLVSLQEALRLASWYNTGRPADINKRP
ncbi:hypothetical protein [Pseudomonas sp. NPDC089734]|uniref:hypothetical protein n=1 Tax=Pseudomonas sp. NPDC089734 TaxID=3364469 RepID=UPI00382CBE73